MLSRSTQWEAAVAEADYRQFVYENYLDVPNDFQETFRKFAQAYLQQYGNLGYSGDMTLPPKVIQARLVALTLSQMTEYDLNTPLTPEGEDFVDYFLNESRRGYCVHYASAGVLFMRYLGIPARYVTGYLTKVPASGKVEVLDSDAHAWVEIYLDGYGWYPVEMTPPAEIGLAPGEGIGETPPESEESVELDIDINEPEPETPEQKPQTETPEQPDQPTEEKLEQPEESAETDAGIPTWAPWTLVGILVLAIFSLHSWYCSRRRERQFSDSDYSGAVLAMYRHLEQLQPWGTDPTALQPLAQKAQYSRQGITEEEQQQAAVLWLREREKLDRLPKLRRFWLRWILGVL